MNTESWKDVPGYEGVYRVSSLGRVVSLHSKHQRILVPVLRNNGYLHVKLCGPAGKKQVSIHCLVAGVFIGPRPLGLDVSHINGDKSDNRYTNLLYESHSDNCSRRRSHGTAYTPKGELHHAAKLSVDKVGEIFRLRSNGASQKKIAKIFGVTQSNISRVLSGALWAGQSCPHRT